MARTLETLTLAGGVLIFDFTNTVNTRHPAPEFDYLQTFDDFLTWTVKVGSVPKKRAQAIRDQVATKPKMALSHWRDAINTRENLYQLFSAIAAGKSPDAVTVKAFNESLVRSFEKINMTFEGGRVEVHMTGNTISPDEPLDAVIKSAHDVLTREHFHRIKECPRCGWLFLDTSKNGKRKWCDMNVCGSREKALDYYYRKSQTS